MAKNGAQTPTEKPEAQKGSATKMPCPGDDCIADLFTKSVDAPKFRKFTRFILGEATQEHKTALVSRAGLQAVQRVRQREAN